MALRLFIGFILLLNFVFSPIPAQAQELPLGDGLIEGPGLFSGEEGAFSLFETKKSTEKAATITNNKSASIDDFVMFKAFIKAKSENTQDYQTFLIWLEYQTYAKENERLEADLD